MQVDIKNYEGLYQITDDGRVWSIKWKRYLRPSTATGYSRVTLCKNGNHDTVSIHQLVAEAFIPNPENKPVVDHINTIKTDNRVVNLRWSTPPENMNNPLTKEKLSETHLGEKNPMYGKRGEESPNFGRTVTEETKKKISEALKGKTSPRKGCHLTEETLKKIRKEVIQSTLDDEVVREWSSAREASIIGGFNYRTISQCCNGKRKTHGGFKWKFKYEG